MPPKADESLVRLFTSLGLNEAKGVEYAKSKHSKILNESIQEIGLENAKLDEKMATLIASTITVDKQFNSLPLPYKTYIIEKIKNGDLKESNQVTGASDYSLVISLTVSSRCQIPLRQTR